MHHNFIDNIHLSISLRWKLVFNFLHHSPYWTPEPTSFRNLNPWKQLWVRTPVIFRSIFVLYSSELRFFRLIVSTPLLFDETFRLYFQKKQLFTVFQILAFRVLTVDFSLAFCNSSNSSVLFFFNPSSFHLSFYILCGVVWRVHNFSYIILIFTTITIFLMGSPCLFLVGSPCLFLGWAHLIPKF